MYYHILEGIINQKNWLTRLIKNTSKRAEVLIFTLVDAGFVAVSLTSIVALNTSVPYKVRKPS
jgi:hypothetical protein